MKDVLSYISLSTLRREYLSLFLTKEYENKNIFAQQKINNKKLVYISLSKHNMSSID